MARIIEQNRITEEESGVSLEHHYAYDDSLLPSAEKLSRLKEIEPDIVRWLMNRAEKEQDARIEFNHRRMQLAHKEMNLSAILTFCRSFVCLVGYYRCVLLGIPSYLKRIPDCWDNIWHCGSGGFDLGFSKDQ